MKKFKLFKILSTFAIAAAGAVAVGVGTKAPKVEAAEADIDVNIGNSGKIFLQLNTNEWKSSGSKIGLYMFNNDEGKNAWGNLVTPSGTSRFVEYSYNLDFTPKGCIAFRLDPGVQSIGTWCWENNRGNTAIWSTTNDIDFNNVVWLGNYYSGSKWTESGSYNIDAVVKGGSSDSWQTATVNTRLTDVKVNSSDNLEVYGDVTLPANTYFKIVKGGSTWCGSYSAHSSISSNLSNSGSGNIHNVAAATYEFYFDYDGETTYITDPIKAAADEWSQTFMTGGCTTATTGTKAKWGTHASSFAALVTKYGSSFTALFTSEPHVDHKDTASGYIGEAMQRYDYVLELYGVNDANTDELGYQDFIGRVAANKVTPNLYSGLTLNLFGNNDDNGLVVLIVVISIVSVSALAGLLFARKRKHI